MRIGVGLPTGIAGVDGKTIITWAKQADTGPFSSLGVIDRPVYDSYDPFTALAAAASITQRVKLTTMIAISPLRNTTLLAKTATSLDALSGGRLVLGLSIGAREDDYQVTGIDYHQRGRIFSQQLASLHTVWENPSIGPHSLRSGGPPILIGGLSDQTFSRVARYASGYVHGGGPPRAFSRAADKVRAAWSDAGRPGRPELWAQGYFALGEDVEEQGRAYLKDYYAFTGPFADKIAEGLLTTPQAVAGFIRGYEEAGCDELVLFPTLPDLAQIEQLAAVLEQLGRRPA